MHPAFVRARNSIRARLGSDAVLRGEIVDPPIRVNMEHSVELSDGQGGVVVAQDVASIDKELNPKPGDTLAVDSINYKLDVLIGDDGLSMRFILVKV